MAEQKSALKYKAIVLGASGAVGGCVVEELLASPHCEQVTTLGRRQIESFNKHPNAEKIRDHQLIIDVKRLENIGKLSAEQMQDEKVRADAMGDLVGMVQGSSVAFTTLGVGRPSQVSREEFENVDVFTNRGFARVCKQAGVSHISLLGSVGTDENASNFYLKTKFQAEKGLWENGFARVSLFRPSVLITAEKRYGAVDFFNHHIFPAVALVLPNRFHHVKVTDLAKAMRVNAEVPFSPSRALPKSECPFDGVEALTYDDFISLASSQ